MAPPPERPSTATRPVLAVLEVINEGPQKGLKFDVRRALTSIGRGDHNDLVIASESVSDTHAKLQKREAGWCIVDADSTNGTYVGGRRVKGEQMLEGAPDLRFGDVKVAFRPVAGAVEAEKGTRAITGVSIEEARRMAARRSTTQAPPEAASPAPVAAPPAAAKVGMPAWIWVVIVLVIAIAAYFVVRGL